MMVLNEGPCNRVTPHPFVVMPPARRERDHDDTALAAAMAVWHEERYCGPCTRLEPAPVVRRTIADRMAARSAASRWGLFGRKH
jgi:hypothetical protein